MSAHTMESTSILTEHFDYPPISIIDDIINAVNLLMYKCTQAMENYLLKTIQDEDKAQATEASIEKKMFLEQEIKIGTAKLESLLEHAIDKNFDKLELYLLRNILNIPDLDERFFRLKHQLNLEKIDDYQLKNSEEKVNLLLTEINIQIRYNKQLSLRLQSFKELEEKTIKFKECLNQFFQLYDHDDNELLLQQIQPIDTTIKFLNSQILQITKELDKTNDIKKLYEQYKLSTQANSSGATGCLTSSRIQYMSWLDRNN
ncbi:MIND complex subunit MTW1 SCDLUD_000456 [Saccharomycodes ludwigii]|uniref:MIND complex subunit MTW1 n=1 Tax=Saccharomycodes ludwigii TaxID=36035 RepID=UPI001E86F88B|nr:hypothetical protein SCDLUD_000456 [Saccharomycodes ludwigii]KAH3902862.1 hypothetical protein SCDLUD_000456 [Saccharomycodes ludwigii]